MNLKLEEESELNITKNVHQRLEDDDKYFQELIDLIPPKFYFDDETIETLTNEKHKITNEIVEDLKMMRSEKGKNSVARFNPYQHKTVSKIQEELDKKLKKTSKSDKLSLLARDRSSNLQELQERLRTKIAALSAKRRNMSKNEKQLKRKMSKLKNNKTSKKIKFNNNVEVNTFPKSINEQKLENNKPIYNKDKKMNYSKFELEETENKNKSRHPGKNYKKLLQKTLKVKEEMEALQKENPEKAFIKREKLGWRKAIDKSEGKKIKDDPQLLKKSIKKRNQMKKQSQKKWEERKELVKKFQQKKQQKRKDNIKARKQEKINKKIKRAKKKGRILPEF